MSNNEPEPTPLPGSYQHPTASSSRKARTPTRVDGDWEDEEEEEDAVDHRISSLPLNGSASPTEKVPRSPSSHMTKSSGRASPSVSVGNFPSKTRTINRRRDPARRAAVLTSPHRGLPPPLPGPRLSRAKYGSATLTTTISLLISFVRFFISIILLISRPFLPYLLLALIISSAVLYLPPRLPSFLFKAVGYLLHTVSSSWLDSLSWWPSLVHGDHDIALARGVALLPLRSLATPACALTGLACHLSLFSRTSSDGDYIHLAKPIWQSTIQTVDVAGVARNLTKDVKGAKDIFESIAMLSEGGMMDRLEYVRIWELGVAVSVGSNLEGKDIVAQQLLELGDDSRDLSDELIDINAMAVNAFTWVQWEFAGLVKTLTLPPSNRPTSSALATILNSQLGRLHSALGDLHRAASRANIVAARGSEKGRLVRNHLRSVEAGLQRVHQREPGWKQAVDRAGHFFVGGDPSKSELIGRDLDITEIAISTLGDVVHGLEHSRSSIKGFRDQIGYFDASMMGFHLGASEAVGVGPEEEVRVLGDVVEEFGRSIGRAKQRALPETDEVKATRIEGPS